MTGTEAKRLVYIWKVKVVYPDGAEREFRPAGHNDILGDGYFNVNPHTGEKRDVVVTCIGTDVDGNPVCGCNTGSVGTAPNPLTYFSTDGTYTRLVITRGSGWTLSFPDGSRVVSNSGGHNSIASFFYDRNNNFLTRGNVTLPTGEVVGGLVDQFGRYVAITANSEARESYIYSLGFNNQSLKWTVKWKTIFVLRNYRTTAASTGRTRGNTSDQTYQGTFDVVDRITLPPQLGSLSYVFSYNAPDYVDGTPEPTTPSVGWGEVSGITLPSGAQASYQYSQDSTTRPSVRFVLDGHLRRKTLTYQAQYDGELTPVSEAWAYSVGRTSSSIRGPDGGLTTFTFKDTTLGTATAGQVFKETYPSGEVLERDWQPNKAPTSVASSGFNSEPVSINFYVKTEFRSIPDVAGNLAWTAIKAFNYDKNGNVTRVAEYDWVPYSSYVAAGGIPAGSTPIRVTVTTYANATPDATDGTTDSVGAYWTATGAPTLRAAPAAKEIQNGAGQKFTRAEFSYDNPLTTGNLTQQKTWDSSKGAYSNPLVPGNSISVSTQYDQYGIPTLTTDARQVKPEVIYGLVGTVSDLYPTEVKTALGTTVQRTEKREYDFSSGLVKKVTDVDNGVSTSTQYDDLGRPTLVRAAEDEPEETQTSTQYFDSERRVVVRADLDRKVTGSWSASSITTSWDVCASAGGWRSFPPRVLLMRQLASKCKRGISTLIRVSQRMLAQCLSDNDGTIGTYVLTSNPYRAATSGAASTESTMGWTRARRDRRGRPVETQTFISGTSLPAPWGTNGNSTGTVVTSYDAIFTTITDQAGKVRRSKIDAIGQLVRVDEPNAANTLGSPDLPTQATSYQYDPLGNLTSVTQGTQPRDFKYTSLSRLREATNPESGKVTYVYDENGNLKTKTDARNIVCTYVYDELNRVTSRSYSDNTPTVDYGYDAVVNAKGRLTSVTSSVSSYTYGAVDVFGRVKSATQTTDGQPYIMSYQYNLAGGTGLSDLSVGPNSQDQL